MQSRKKGGGQVENQILTVNKAIPTSSSSLNTEKKVWQKPQMKELMVKKTKLGLFQSPTESWDTIFLGGAS